MSSRNQTDAFFDDVLDRLHKVANKTVDVLIEATSEADKDAHIEFGIYQQIETSRIFKDAVTEFYNAYTPKYYKNRRGSLYNVLDLQTDEYGMVIAPQDNYAGLFDDSKMYPDRQGGNSLFQTVFMEGYHGGSRNISSSKSSVWGAHPSPGTPYYRRPGIVTYKDGTRKRHRYGKWGRAAVKTKAPYQIFNENMDLSMRSDMWNKFVEISNRHILGAADRVQREKVPQIYKEFFG